jgi:formylglycine-generating enzyme required for sulfatase activity
MAYPRVLETTSLKADLIAARRRTDELFRVIRPEAIYDRPVAERHRLIFYLGHLEAFDWNQICLGALSLPAFHPEFDRLFAFGIDPPAGQLPNDAVSAWPAVKDVLAYNRRVRKAVDAVFDEAPLEICQVAVEHRLMHAETLAYLLHDLPLERKIAPPADLESSGPIPPHSMIEITNGPVTLGCRRAEGFGWDNEFEAHTVEVQGFAIDKHKVTNQDYLEFVLAGASAPHFWRRRGNRWLLRTMFDEIPLPLAWPVYVTQQQAAEYAAWRGQALPTEAQFHRAAYGTRTGEERSYPWGDEPPDEGKGNFDFRRWDPLPVAESPAGSSAFGVSQLVGNGWEWTATVFGPFPGFEPFSFYPGYSAPFFGGEHYVLKGASPRTAACFLRRSFRNWFRSTYRHVYAGFRCVDN